MQLYTQAVTCYHHDSTTTVRQLIITLVVCLRAFTCGLCDVHKAEGINMLKATVI